ncbi:Glycosyl transferases group 1 [Duganella sp. CF517]|uniref:glycosyltransferase family 4 protein n=1 Tax=Duganella sp. CF517 TaxID=1881038 RepID=UPI0008D12004|nr:glycosyltransferase family 1 protein [Duganella sp. CF517]SEO21155.1 Glycosyl transferases group 1 [Duganella sp. CF517]
MTPEAPRAAPQLLLDLSELVLHDARSGVQRVTRGLLAALLAAPPAGYVVRPVYDAGGYYAYAEIDGDDAGGAGRHRPAAAGAERPLRVAAGDIFLGLDLALEAVARNRAVLESLRLHGVRLHFFVHDLLPLRHPEWFVDGVVAAFARWFDTIAALADGLVCNSRATADDLLDWLAQRPPTRAVPPRVGVAHLGADIAATAPSGGVARADEALLARLAGRPTLLMVGTLEPRKMHAQALEAFEQLWRGGDDVNLVIVGKPGWRVDGLDARLRGHPELDRRLFWLEQASDELLLRLYGAGDALLAASRAEGFGLPLIEAAQHGLPVIARDLPVFREVGGAHAWYFEAADGAQLAAALRAWLALRAAGRAPGSAAMPHLDWAASAGQLLACVIAAGWYKTGPAALP